MTDTGTGLEVNSHLLSMWRELHSQFEGPVVDSRGTVIVAAGIGLTVFAIVAGTMALVQTTMPWWIGTGLITLGVVFLVSVCRLAV